MTTAANTALARCPGCRARLVDEPICPRCGCDLALVRRAEAQAQRLTVQAVQAWARGDHRAARSNARAALRLQHQALTKAILDHLPTARLGAPFG